MDLAEFLFWLSFTLLIAVYFGYPVFLHATAGFKADYTNYGRVRTYFPSVTLLISVFNEAEIIDLKLKNSLEQDYPVDKYNIVVVSDGSTDDTENIVKKYDYGRVKFFQVEAKKGKTNAINVVMPELTSEIVVFSDANSMYAPDAIKLLVNNFQNKQVGGVCGKLFYYKEGRLKLNEPAEGLYWKYENWIKDNESKISKMIVFNGSIYAIRRTLHKPMNIQAANDLQHPLQVLMQGYKNIYAPEAVACEKTWHDDRSEFNRHVRIALRGWKGLAAYPQILFPGRFGLLSFHFFVRKVLRWLSPLFLITIFIANSILFSEPFYGVFLYIQISFYLLALIGFLLSRIGFNTTVNIFFYFCMANAALLVALIKFCCKTDSSVWIPTSHLR